MILLCVVYNFKLYSESFTANHLDKPCAHTKLCHSLAVYDVTTFVVHFLSVTVKSFISCSHLNSLHNHKMVANGYRLKYYNKYAKSECSVCGVGVCIIGPHFSTKDPYRR